MWHAYNLIREGDRVTATTFRKIAKDSGVGADSERIKLKLTIEVEGIEFDAEGERRGSAMKGRGGGCGSYHSDWI